MIATIPDVPGTMTVGGDRHEAMARITGALLVMLAARIDDREPVPLPSKPGPGQSVLVLGPLVVAKLAIYEAMRSQRLTPEKLARRLDWDLARVQRLLDVRRRSRLEDIEAALGGLGKRLVIEVQNAA